MLSWVFRHRERLAAIYGAVELPPLAGERFADREGRTALPELRRGERPRPGIVARRGETLWVAPLPRRAA